MELPLVAALPVALPGPLPLLLAPPWHPCCSQLPVKNCRFCAHFNYDSATRCRECGAEFAGETAAQPDTATEKVDNQSFDTNSFARSNRFYPEYWLLFGVILSASGYSYTVVAAIGLYLLLRHIRPKADWELLVLASSFTGANLLKSYQLFSAHQTPVHFLEPFLVANAAITLFYTRQRAWARLLLIYSALAMLVEPTVLFMQAPRSFPTRDALLGETLLGLAVWLLIRWMARQKPVSDTAGHTSIFVLRKT